MKLVGRVPVEPLDDERMTNIERRIVANAAVAPAPRAPRRVLGFAAAAMAAMAAGVIGWKLGTSPVQTSTVAEAPISIATTATGGTLNIGDATIESDPSTQFVVTRPDGGVLVDLKQGRVELEVAKRTNRPALVVRAGDTDVIVVGTHFSVDWDGSGEVDVRVTEGTVKIVRHKKESLVAAGEAWEPKRGTIKLADAKPVARRTGGGPAVASVTAGESGAGATIGEVSTGSGSAGYEIEIGDGPDVLRGRTAQVPDARTPRTGAGGSNAARTEPRETTPKAGSGSDAGAGDGPINIVALIKQHAVESPVDVGESVSASAVSRYQEMIRNSKTGDEESRAYYGIAYLQAMKMGRTEDALRTISTYERRFAQGRVYPERASIAWLKLRILCSRRLDGECKQVAAAYQRIAGDTAAGRLAERVTLGD
ncbi:MAG: FecR domain-containing protein [Deltaproteobacteria bacterium]|nr:FecR domain-containing protein [Deltaproteobacteria bacterium]